MRVDMEVQVIRREEARTADPAQVRAHQRLG